ncbi:SCAN domain-containing protein 3, partial [Nosema granulosis]
MDLVCNRCVFKICAGLPLHNKSGVEVSETLKSLFLRHTGRPGILQRDNGKEFINKEMKELFIFCISFKHSRSRSPKANEQIERFNQTLTRSLQKYIFEAEETNNASTKYWIKHLDKVLYKYNQPKHSATKKTPFRLFLKLPGYNTTIKNDESNEESSVTSENLNTNFISHEDFKDNMSE